MSFTWRTMTCTAIVSLSGCLGTPRDHHRPPGHRDITIAAAPTSDAILFTAVGAGGRDLYVLNVPDQKVARIAETPEYEIAPSFSRDGLRIVYAAGVPGDRADHIFTMRHDGSGKRQLTDIDANDMSPRFSPDGKMIVFARDKTYNWGGLAANWQSGGVICVMDSDGSNARQLTSERIFAFEPYFSPDGTHVIYSTLNGRMSIPVDGLAVSQPLSGAVGAVPSWDGELVAYSEGKFSSDSKIYVAHADGTSEKVLTPSVGGCYQPVFARTGEKVFFLREEWRDGPAGAPAFSLWEVALDGASARMVADRRLFDTPMKWNPRFSP